MIYRFRKTQKLPIDAETAWDFISKPENLVRLTPARMNMNLVAGVDKPLYSGQMITMKVSPIPGYRSTWVSEITNVEAGRYFIDEQRSGPYSMWHHQHFVNKGDGYTEIEDIIHYKVPYGWLGRLLHPIFIKPQLEKIFAFRRKKLEEIFGKNTL